MEAAIAAVRRRFQVEGRAKSWALAIETEARPLADMLEAALAENVSLTAERDALSTKCAEAQQIIWTGAVKEDALRAIMRELLNAEANLLDGDEPNGEAKGHRLGVAQQAFNVAARATGPLATDTDPNAVEVALLTPTPLFRWVGR